jgi:hypothetical protein
LVLVLIYHFFSLKKYINSILFGCLFFSLKIGAVYHAGNITYKWLYGYTYQIKYTTYTTNYSPDNYCEIDSVCFGDGSSGGSLIRSNGPSIICAPPAHDGVAISTTIRLNEYLATHTYPGPGNYKICFEQANRNGGISNIPNSANQTISFESMLVIPGFSSGKNDSPTFANHPMAYGCLNNGCFTYNPLATDVDGDSLAYKLVPCSSNAGSPIPGYSFPGAGTGNTFGIDSLTGLLSWCNPQFAGDYNVGIKIEEWRKNDDGDYFLIGYVIRDTQFTIDDCTGISDIVGKDQSISVYPNPVTDYMEIKFSRTSDEIYTIELTDVTGKTVAGLLKDSAIKPSMIFDMKEFSSGIYFVKINGKNKTTIKKLIKQ